MRRFRLSCSKALRSHTRSPITTKRARTQLRNKGTRPAWRCTRADLARRHSTRGDLVWLQRKGRKLLNARVSLGIGPCKLG
ncbi:hypothetical protein ES288_D11G122000v1 [Gossypium darwinii]|uniref:Uncharacterized protein n=1 Tax=Gossypium darwinii TaxID=34276 RepID=A0A5D2ALP6_GOSDA|nr:hypothetical protein ES288_D11G122000v1 [Gossypium darwinii]